MGEPKSTFMAKIGQPAGEQGRGSKYAPEHCDRVRMLAQAGEFPEAWASEIGVSVETLRRWGHQYPEFHEALIAAKHLLATFWTRELAKNRDNPNAKPGLYHLLVRRIPALYGKEPVDLAEYVTRPPEAGDEPKALSEDQVKASASATLEERLAVLRRRREEEGGAP